MKLTLSKVNLGIALGLSSFLFLLPPGTYVAALFCAVLLLPSIFMKVSSYLKASYILKVRLPECFLLIAFLYFFLCSLLVTNYYLAIKELIMLTCGVGLFCVLYGQSYKANNLVFLSIMLASVTLALSAYTLTVVDISNYKLMEMSQVESKNPLGTRVAFSITLLLALLFYESFLGRRVKLTMAVAVIFGLIALSVLESTRGIMYLIINISVWFLVSIYRKFKGIFFSLSFPLLILLTHYKDQILEYLSGYGAISLLFFKLEPYIPGINKYGILQGGAFSRSDFTDQASQIAYLGLSQRPLFGRGPDNSRVLFQEEMGILTNSHSNFFEIGLSYGLIGVLIWYLYFGAIWYVFLTGEKSKYFGFCLGFMISMFVISVISPIYREADIYVMYALMLCLLAMSNHRDSLEKKLTN